MTLPLGSYHIEETGAPYGFVGTNQSYEALYHDPQLFYPLGDSIFVENCSPERYRQVMNPEEHREKRDACR